MPDLFSDPPYLLLILGFAYFSGLCGFDVYGNDVGTLKWFPPSLQRPE
jgi:hypothetical protein